MNVKIVKQDGSVGFYVNGEYVSCIACEGEESHNICEIEYLFTFLGVNYEVDSK